MARKNSNEQIKYRGKWVVLLGDDVVAYGEDVEKVVTEAEKSHAASKLVLAKVPQEGTLIY